MTSASLNPIPLKDRVSMIFLQYGQIDVIDGAFVLIDKTGSALIFLLARLPASCWNWYTGFACSCTGCASWNIVGMGGGSGRSCLCFWSAGGARSDKLLYQAKLALDEDLRLKVVRKMFELRFGEPAPARRSVEQLRGIEGSRVRATYALLAKQYGVTWNGRRYDPKDWEKGDTINQCISAATSCLYGVTEAAILAAGYAPAIGFVHTGKPLSFVYDIADIIKFDTVVPKAFEIARRNHGEPDREVRLACRDIFAVVKH